MDTDGPRGLWARLGALAALATLGTALAGTVLLRGVGVAAARSHAAAAATEERLAENLDTSVRRALDAAYADGDAELADSLERLRAARDRGPRASPAADVSCR